MAVITTFSFNKYLKNLDEKYKKNQNKIQILVPREDISKYTKATNDMFEYKEFDVDSVHAEAIKNFSDIEGTYVLTDLKKGEVLFLSRFIDQYNEEKLITRKIREGYRAVSIEVNFVQSVSNLVQPENFVDVIFSEKIINDTSNNTVNTEILLHNVRVLAVGKRLIEKFPKDSPEGVENEKVNEIEYISVTLELKPIDVVKVVNAAERGTLTFIELILNSFRKVIGISFSNATLRLLTSFLIIFIAFKLLSSLCALSMSNTTLFTCSLLLGNS